MPSRVLSRGGCRGHCGQLYRRCHPVRDRRPQHRVRGCFCLRSSLHPHRHHQSCAGLRAGPEHPEADPGVKRHEHRTAPASPALHSGLLRPWLQRSLCGAHERCRSPAAEVPGTKIQLTFSTDTLCSCCPNKLGTDLCDTQEKVKRYDRKTVEYFGLEEKEYDYQALIREIDAKATPRCWPISAGIAAGSPSAPAARISAKANT